MKKVKMTPSEAIVETLLAEGVDHVCGIVGSAFMDMLDLFPTAGIKFIPVRHEQSAAHGHIGCRGKYGTYSFGHHLSFGRNAHHRLGRLPGMRSDVRI